MGKTKGIQLEARGPTKAGAVGARKLTPPGTRWPAGNWRGQRHHIRGQRTELRFQGGLRGFLYVQSHTEQEQAEAPDGITGSRGVEFGGKMEDE